MNTYEITFTRENGSTGKDRITAANEKQARKDFREIYRHSSATITDVIVAAENVPASKQQERDALDQIRATEFRPSNKCLTHASSYRDVIKDLLHGYWS